MTAQTDEHERTLAFAEIALGQIKALRQPAYPRNYEVWYAYATGYNPSLNQTINETLDAQRHADRRRPRADLRDLSLARPPHRPHRQCRRPDRRRDRAGHGDDRRRASARPRTTPKASRTRRRASAPPRTATACAPSSRAWCAPRATWKRTTSRLEQSLNASKQEINQLQNNLEAVRNESLTDPLTSLANRKYFDQALDKFIAQSVASGEPLSLLLTDIDHFKTFNDTFGHLTGDQVLRLVAMAVKQNVKGQDIAARYGGEEFAIILPEHRRCARR